MTANTRWLRHAAPLHLLDRSPTENAAASPGRRQPAWPVWRDPAPTAHDQGAATQSRQVFELRAVPVALQVEHRQLDGYHPEQVARRSSAAMPTPKTPPPGAEHTHAGTASRPRSAKRPPHPHCSTFLPKIQDRQVFKDPAGTKPDGSAPSCSPKPAGGVLTSPRSEIGSAQPTADLSQLALDMVELLLLRADKAV